MLSKSLDRSHFEYRIWAWNPHLKRDIDTLEIVHRWATKMVSGLENVPFEERLLNLPHLKQEGFETTKLKFLDFKRT